MRIKEISIQNFRSYYGQKVFKISEGLTLIIGSNGDGKSTFWDALHWLMDTTGKNKMDVRYISKKRLKELNIGEEDEVKVTMTYDMEGDDRTLVRSFKFTRLAGDDLNASISGFNYTLYVSRGSQRLIKDGFEYFEQDFKADIRQYCMFKGESDLTLLSSKRATDYLIMNFSKVADYEPFVEYLKYAREQSGIAVEHTLNADRRNAKKANILIASIKQKESEIAELKRQLRDAEKNFDIYSSKLDNVEKDRETSELLNKSDASIRKLEGERDEIIRRIRDYYTYRMLDDMWILRGFGPIAREFSEKVAVLSKERRKQERAYDQASAVKKLFDTNAPKDFVPLAVHVPDEKTMREMLEDEVCKVCGRKAPKGSEAYIYMQQKLDAFLESLKPQEDEEDSLFSNEYIIELGKRETTLNDNLNKITKLPQKMDDELEFHDRLRKNAEDKKRAIEKEEDLKHRILAQSAATEDELKNLYDNINVWWSERSLAANNKTALEPKIEKAEAELEELQEELSKLSKDSIAAKVAIANKAFIKMESAFKMAMANEKTEFLLKLEAKTNEYLAQLNRHDFMGSARITSSATNGELKIRLADADGSTITDPNTALETTMYMSLLFGISDLSKGENRGVFPLIFDAPTSSFTTAKESAFFQIISRLNKQVIIVTKSFLDETEDGDSVLDISRTSEIDGRIYRIEKERPFNDKDLTTINTTLTTIKM